MIKLFKNLNMVAGLIGGQKLLALFLLEFLLFLT